MSSDRRTRLPSNWSVRRLSVLKRDGFQCVAILRDTGARCTAPATDVDHHIVPGDDHDPANLQALCRWHHARKSSAEGAVARARGARRPSRLRGEGPHLGEL